MSKFFSPPLLLLPIELLDVQVLFEQVDRVLQVLPVLLLLRLSDLPLLVQLHHQLGHVFLDGHEDLGEGRGSGGADG